MLLIVLPKALELWWHCINDLSTHSFTVVSGFWGFIDTLHIIVKINLASASQKSLLLPCCCFPLTHIVISEINSYCLLFSPLLCYLLCATDYKDLPVCLNINGLLVSIGLSIGLCIIGRGPRYQTL